MRRRLSSRCKGLLEVTWSFETGTSIVQYLHRTVKDFLRRADIWKHILSGAEPFNPDLILAGISLHAVKAMTLTRHPFMIFWKYFKLCVDHSLSLDSTETHLEFVDELKQTGDTLFANQILLPGVRHWTGTCGLNFSSPFDNSFLSFFGFAFRYKLHSYVQREIAAGQALDSLIVDYPNRSMLYNAVVHSDLKMLTIVLDAGGDPNHRNANSPTCTPWRQALQCIDNDSTKLDYWAQVVGLFLDHGADPYARSIYTETLVTDVIKQNFGGWDPIKTRELLEKVETAKRMLRKSNKKRKLRTFWCFW
jgi:hypothetical protein